MRSEFNFSLSSSEEESSEERFQTFMSVLTAHRIALWVYETESGKCSFLDNYFEVLGLEAAGIVFSDMTDFLRFVHPHFKSVYVKEFEALLHSQAETFRWQVSCVGTKGETVWLEHRFSRKPGTNGRSGRLIAYTRNITDEIEKEEKIRKLEEKNRKIIEVIPEFIFVFDKHFFIRDVLKAQTIELLHPREMLVGADARTIYAPEVSELFIRNIRACLQDKKLKEIEYYLDMDGFRHYFQARMVPFGRDQVLALIHDIGNRVQRTRELIEAKQKAEEADRMKSLFLANMSHEIRTPLNAIVGFSELIASTEEKAEKQEYMEIIRKNTHLLLQLINDVLDLSRIESGKTELYPEPMEVSEWMEEMRKMYTGKTTEGVAFEVLVPDQDIWITTDRNRLSQIIFNLLSNAIKNTRQGSIVLGMQLAGDRIEIFVRDTGCGISPEGLTRIFDRFEKLNDFAQGTGLGLPICQALAECLGGHISVESEVSAGSTFTLVLPLN